MAFLIWVIVGISVALLINTFKGHNTLLNSSATIIGAIISGGSYALYTKDASTSIYSTLTQSTWENFAASIIGSVALGVLAQLFTLEMREYETR